MLPIRKLALMLIASTLILTSLTIAAPVTQITNNYTTKDNKIFLNEKEIKLNGVSWFGSEVRGDYMPHGLWSRNYKDMITQIKQTGFNAIRFPFCPNTLKSLPVGYFDTDLNPSLVGKNSLQIMDIMLQEINDQGMYILLDHHRPDCDTISELWYTNTYSERSWIADLSLVVRRYKRLPMLMGIEIKNEPHGASTWSNSRPTTDFNKAAERAGKTLLRFNPNILIYVGGIANNPECDTPMVKWWGGNLAPVRCFPIINKYIPENKLVFSPHVYGPDVSDQPYFVAGQLKNTLPPIWENHFAGLSTKFTIVPTEFGGFYKKGSLDVEWQNTIIDYFIDKRICNTFYWSWNPNSSDTGGILEDDWNTIDTRKLNNLKRLHTACNTNETPIKL